MNRTFSPKENLKEQVLKRLGCQLMMNNAGPMALLGAGTYLLRFSRAAARCLESNRQEQFNSLAICCLRICICPTCDEARERTGRTGKYFKVMAGGKHQDDTFSGEDHHTLQNIEGWRGLVHGSGDPSGDIWVDSWTPPSKCSQGLTSYKVIHSCSVVHVLKESLLKLYFCSFGVRSPKLLAAMRSPTSCICPKQNSLKS